MSEVFRRLLTELTPIGLDLLNRSLLELASRTPEEARNEIVEMARQTGIATAARKGFERQ